MSSAIKSNIWKYYLFSFISVFLLYTPFIIYYFQDLGFSLTRIALLFGAVTVTAITLEIPSGYIADKFGRKKSMLSYVFLQLIAIIILYLATSFSIVLIAHIFLGAAIAFLSGADTAWIYDSLLTLKKEREFKKIEGRAKFFSGLAGVISALTASLIVVYGIPYTILSSIFVYILLLFVTLSFKEPSLHKSRRAATLKKEFHKFGNIITKSLRNKKLFWLFIYSLVIMGIADTIFINYQPYFRATNVPLYLFGIIFAIFSIVHGLSALKAEAIEKKIGVFGSLLLMPILLICTLLSASMIFLWFGFVFFLLRESARGFFFPVIGDYTHKLTNSKERATVMSIENMFSRVGFAVILLIFGLFSDTYGLQFTFATTGVMLAGFTIFIPFIFKRVNKR
jgi:MFS family permease